MSEFMGKEIVDISDGSRLGVIDECDLALDDRTGRIIGFVLPGRRSFFDFRGGSGDMLVPWQTIKRIGDDIVIVDLSDENVRGRMRY
jgi:YlmC/YmxH family sporulation protein